MAPFSIEWKYKFKQVVMIISGEIFYLSIIYLITGLCQFIIVLAGSLINLFFYYNLHKIQNKCKGDGI